MPDVPAENDRRLADEREPPGARVSLDGIDPYRFHLDDDFGRQRGRVGNLGQPEHLGAAKRILNDRTHPDSP